MKRVLGLLAVLMISTGWAAAQVTIKGRVVRADDGQPVAGAYVMINASDENMAQRTSMTDANGEFSVVSRMRESNITIKFAGMKDYYRVIDPDEGRSVDLETIRLQPDALLAQKVEVKAQAAQATMRGDTLQYNAAAFKTNPDASSEDLLKKMPGVTTDDDGKVEVHGETVGKVYVDGKEFFADDPSVALKTLPADVVESMQVFDDQSDEAKFSGFDDGERIKAVNIVTKNGVSTSTFGRVYGGYATDDRYSAGGAANIFNADHRFTLIAQRNNINNQGFTLNDIANSMSGGRRGMGGGVDASQFTTNVRGGIQTTTMTGANYSGEFSEKLKLNGSYFFNKVNADQWRTRNQYYTSMDREYGDTTGADGYNYEHRMNMRIEWNPNETNRIFFMPWINYSTNHGTSYNFSRTWMDQSLSNVARNDYRTDIGIFNASANLFWMHRFSKAGRTLSVGGMAGGGNSWGRRQQLSEYLSFDAAGTPTADELDQYGTLSAPQHSLMGRVTYSEPLSQSSRLQFSYNIHYNKTESRKYTYDWNPTTDGYSDLDPVTSNLFNRDQTRHWATAGYNFVKDKVVLNASLSYQYNTLNDDETYPRLQDNTYHFNALLPRFRLEFKPTRLQSLVIDYNRSARTPGVSQLQDVIDITNPLQVFYGNPNLNQSYNDQIQVRYNIANPEKSTNFNINARATFTQDYVAYNRRFLQQDENIMGVTVAKGAQVSTPVNLSGYVNTRLHTNYSFRIKPLSSNMNVGLFYNFSRTPSMEENIKYRSKNNRFGMNLSMTSNISEKVDFTVGYRPSVSLTNGSTGSFDRYIRSDLSGSVNIFIVGGLYFNADATWRNSTGTQNSYSQHYALVNASLGYKFMKFQQAEFKLTGYDLLDKNQAFWQSSNDTYTQINTTNILKRYVMLSFTYKFDTRKGRNASNFGTDDSGSRRGSGPGRGPGGPGGPGGHPGGGMGGGMR